MRNVARNGRAAAISALALTLLASLCSAVLDYTLVYIPGWSQNPDKRDSHYFDMATVDLRGVTHATYAFATIDGASFGLTEPYGSVREFFALRNRYPALKLMVSIGGGGYSPQTWTRMSSSPANRAKFVSAVLQFVLKWDADGVDIDWEFPGPSDRDNFILLLRELRTALGLGRLLTAAVPATSGSPSDEDAMGMDIPTAAGILDFINVMAYDLHDPCYWESSTAFHTSWSDITRSLDYFASQNVPPHKILLGLAFYGHQYNLTNKKQYAYPSPSVMSKDCSTMITRDYRDIMAARGSAAGSTKAGIFQSTTERSAYFVDGTSWVGFDVEETLWAKIQGATERGLGGVMIWEVSLDTFPEQNLLKAVVSRGPPPARLCGSGYYLYNNATCQAGVVAQCCGEFGWCGPAESTQCGAGCRSGACSAGPMQSPPPSSPPGTCDNGNIGNKRCADPSACCSKYGWCLNSPAHCGVDCVGGPCYGKSPPSTKPPPQPSAARKPPPKKVSNKPPPPRTKKSPPPPKTEKAKAPPPKVKLCGEGTINSGSCADPAHCCSEWGWCSNDVAHCGTGCRGGPCI